MDDAKENSSSEEELECFNIWDISRKKTNELLPRGSATLDKEVVSTNGTSRKKLSLHIEKFEALKKRARGIQRKSEQRQLKTEKKRTERLIKKACRDPLLKSLICNKDSAEHESKIEEPKEQWEDVKPFLTVNEHIQRPMPHGNCGPKTELECIIDDAIKEGDFEKAEMLSDTLSNREFAVKITRAFAAKRYADKLSEEKAIRKAKEIKKLRWGFETKERWEMKGHM